MTIDIQALQNNLCNTFCSDVRVALSGEKVSVSLPMSARDGDRMTAYLSQTAGGWRISDMGTTMMRLSYENDLGRLLTGARAQLFETILNENGLSEDDGKLYLDVSADALTRGLFTLGQGLTRIEDIGLWTRNRTESTFYEDLRILLCGFLPAGGQLEENYIVPGLPSAESYPVDFRVQTGGRPLYLFGVNGKDKAMLTTIILQHLQQNHQSFDSMVVCSNIDDIPKPDRRRLMNAANDVVPYIQDASALKQKIEHRMVR